jgi:hypothetical protein
VFEEERSVLLTLLHHRVGLLPEKIVHQLNGPFGRTNQIAESFGSSSSLFCSQYISPSFAEHESVNTIPKCQDDLDRLQQGSHQPFIEQFIGCFQQWG